jgi:glycosyltransferase involved in cell wall biosynthesis
MVAMVEDPAVFRGEHIAHLIESTGPGGAERMVAELALEQRVRGARTTVFLPVAGEEWLADQLEGADIAIERFRHDSPLSPQCVRTLAHGFRKHGITLAHSHEFSMAVNGAVAARAVGIPHVITMHGGRYYADKMRRRFAMRFAVASSQATVAVSELLAGQLSHDLHVAPSRIVTIPNGVRPAEPPTATLRRELGIAAHARVILAVGNLYPVKGHRFLISALAELPASTHLAIAGRGDGETALLAHAAELGLESRVHLLGHRDDIPALLAAADVFVQSSLNEGLPLAVLEAMFAGRPIVATDVGDVARAVGADGALLVAPGSAAELAAAIGRLLDQPFLASALGASAALRANRTHGLTRMVERYAALYAPLLARMPRARTAVLRSIRSKTSANTSSD